MQFQIVKGFTERQSITVQAEHVMLDDDESDAVKDFLSHTLQTGHRYIIYYNFYINII